MKSVSIEKEEHEVTDYRQMAQFLSTEELSELNNILRLWTPNLLVETEDLSLVKGSLAEILSGRVTPGQMSQDAARGLAKRDFIQACKGKLGLLGGLTATREFLTIELGKPRRRHTEALLEAYRGQLQVIAIKLEKALEDPIKRIVKARPVGAFKKQKNTVAL